jgi:hypothetical protein
VSRLDRRLQSLTVAAEALAATLAVLQAQRDGLDPADPGTPAERARLDAALAAATRLSDDVAQEQAALAAAPAAETDDPGAERTLLAWLASRPDLAGAVAADPVPSALARPPALTAAAVAAVAAAVPPTRPGPGALPALQAAAGSDEGFDQLVALAVRDRLSRPEADRPVLQREVAVLLPLRLETVFRQGNDATWTMRVRIVPDEASIRRHDPVPTPLEVRLATAMWQAVHDALAEADRPLPADRWLDREASRTAWEVLCRQVTPTRAAWLAGAFPPVLAGETVTIDAPAADHPSPPNRVGGFPPTIEIWCAFAGEAPARLAVTTVDPAALVFDVIGGRAEVDGTVVEQADRWWVSFVAAKAVGLGLELGLPDGHGPADIAVLYAIGLGDEHPAAHIQDQADAGELALMTLGAATNAVDGNQAANLGHDPDDWRRVAADRLRGGATYALGQALGGQSDTVTAIPGADGVPDLDQALVRSLWPALWGHHLRDVWGFGDAADRLGAWAGEHLRPEGGLPAIRIAEQPYGLLPTSIMSRWRPSPEEGDEAACEERMLPALLRLRSAAASAARARGTAVGADTSGLLDLLGHDALSPGYVHRLFVPSSLLASLYGAVTGVKADEFAAAVRGLFEPAEELFGQRAARQYLAGDADPLTMPLVVPRTWPDWFWKPGEVDDKGNPVPAMTVEEGLTRLLDLLVRWNGWPYDLAREQWRLLPDSLLIRLLLWSWLMTASTVVAVNSGSAAPLLEPPVGSTATPTRLRALGQTWNPGVPDDHPAGLVRRYFLDGLDRIYKLLASDPPPPGLVSQFERSLRATIDTATHRVDPWLVGMASRRLAHLAAQSDTRFRLGVYGWVEGPMLGAPGPTTGGLLHAPSHAQALTAVILRDKMVTDRLTDPGGRDLWSMQLDSARIRLAEEMAEEVRLGAHLFEVVGRQVERIVAARDGVRALRAQFPLRVGQDEAGRVCSGVAALEALLSAAPPLALTAGQTAGLSAVRDAIDAYGDLLVAEAVHQVVTGRADLAGAAMDAAAGLGAPPTLAFTETPLQGEGLVTSVFSAIPFVASVAADGASPVVLADASVAAAVVAATGAAPTWTFTTAGGTSVTLADLGLEPSDTLVLSPDLLTGLAGFRLGEPVVGGTGPNLHRQAQELVHSLGPQPALGRDLARITGPAGPGGAGPAGPDAVAAADAAILAELRGRYQALRDEAQRTIDALTAATTAADGAAQVAGLRRALRWGITPMVGHDEQAALFAALLDGTVPADATVLPTLTSRAGEALGARLRAAPAADAQEPIGRSIAELAAPEGQLAVLARMPVSDLTATSGIVLAPDADLDTDWLATVAAVRPPLARLEALQLEALIRGTPGYTPVSNAPGDHWRVAALADLVQHRTQPGADPNAALPRFVAGYGQGDVWVGGEGAVVAAGLVDSWSESVARPGQTTTAAFGFNAPAARPPQAILLAVPGDLDTGYGAPAEVADLIQVLSETRQLAHARAVRAEDLGGLLAGVPTAMLQGTGDTGIKLKGTTF